VDWAVAMLIVSRAPSDGCWAATRLGKTNQRPSSVRESGSCKLQAAPRAEAVFMTEIEACWCCKGGLSALYVMLSPARLLCANVARQGRVKVKGRRKARPCTAGARSCRRE
jgi:hypothetical protein